MIVSPSIASGDPLRIAQELDFIDKYFDSVHIDIEDGNAVRNISFGFKTAIAICDYSSSSDKTIHLEVTDPLVYLDKLKQCKADVIFIQADALADPVAVMKRMIEEGLTTGVNLSNLDMDRPCLEELLQLTDYVLVNTTHHDDPAQICDERMLEYALKLAEQNKKVWIDGGITLEIFERVRDSKIHAAVMGRAVFGNREMAIEKLGNKR